MKMEISGEALKLLEDFIYYSKHDFGAMADALEYDIDGFKKRIRLLEKSLERAK